MRYLLTILLLIPGIVGFSQDKPLDRVQEKLTEGDTAKAISILRETIRDKGMHWVLLQNIGLLYHQTGKRDSSTHFFLLATKANRDIHQPHYYIGHYYFDLDSNQLAYDHYSSYLRGDKENREILHYRAQAAMKLKDFYSAISDWSTLLEGEEEPGVFFNRGLSRMGLNDQEGARTDFNRALELRPDYGDAFYYMGLSYLKTYDDKDAIKWWEKAVKTNPADVRALYQLALTYSRKNKSRKSCKYLEQARKSGWEAETEQELDLWTSCMGK